MSRSPSSRGRGVDWSKIDGVILDVDGTLFDHIALRRPLAARMLAHLVARRMSWRDVQALRHFRRQRDRLALEEAEDIGGLQFERAGMAAGSSPAEIEALVSRWMHQEPLALVSRYALPDARRFVLALRRQGTPTGVFSDYPAQGKLSALQISVDVVRDAASTDVGRLKPCPKGLLRVAEILQVSPARCLIQDGPLAEYVPGYTPLAERGPGFRRRPEIDAV